MLGVTNNLAGVDETEIAPVERTWHRRQQEILTSVEQKTSLPVRKSAATTVCVSPQCRQASVDQNPMSICTDLVAAHRRNRFHQWDGPRQIASIGCEPARAWCQPDDNNLAAPDLSSGVNAIKSSRHA